MCILCVRVLKGDSRAAQIACYGVIEINYEHNLRCGWRGNSESGHGQEEKEHAAEGSEGEKKIRRRQEERAVGE